MEGIEREIEIERVRWREIEGVRGREVGRERERVPL